MISTCAPQRHRLIAQRFALASVSEGWGLRASSALVGHDHAVEAVAALRGLFADESLLHRIGMLARAEALERDDLAPGAAADRDHAGTCRHAVDDHAAGAAFAEPAAIFRSVQFQIVAQHIEQRGIRGGVDVMDPAVDCQADRGLRHAAGTPWPKLSKTSRRALREDTVCIQTCKVPFRPLQGCPLYEQTLPGNWTYIRQRVFSLDGA